MNALLIQVVPYAMPASALVAAIWLVIRVRASRSWPSVEAMIVETRIKKGKTNEPKITYTYTFNGTSYTGKRITIGLPWATSGDYAERTVAAYPKGARRVAYVDPGNPPYSVLMRGFQAGHWFVLVMCAFFFVVGVITAVASGAR
jgi:hypothetical protein